MIPENLAIGFLILPALCFIYIFRGMGSNVNPIWGNIIASGLSAIVCAMVAIWFINGSIVNTTVVGNSTYQIPAGLSISDALQEQQNLSRESTVLGVSGSGMFLRSPMSKAELSANGTTITVHTYDIIQQQYQDFGLMLLYMLGCVASVVLFGWFIIDMRRALREQDEYEANDYSDYGGY